MKREIIESAILKTLWGIVFFIFLFGCGVPSVNNDEILEQVFELSGMQVWECLEKLELISDPNELSEAQRAKYYFLQAKTYIGVRKNIHDSVFNTPISYYKSIKDTAILYECFHLLALKKHRDGDFNGALKILDKNQKLLPFFETDREYWGNTNWRINNLFELERFQDAKDIATVILQQAQRNGEKRDEARALVFQVKINSYENDIVECECNYQKVSQLSKKIGHSYYQKQSLDLLVKLLEKNAIYDKALNYLKEGERIDVSRKEVPKRNLIKSMFFHKRNELDSALHYAEIASQGNDPFIASIATSYISEWLANDGDFFEAFYRKRAEIKIEEDIERDLSFKKQREESAEKESENKAKISKIEQEKRTLLFVTVIIVLLLIVIMTYLFFYRKQRKQYEAYLKSKAVQLEQDNLLLNQSKEISLLREKESLLRESLFRRIDILKKIPSITPSELDVDSIDSRKITLTENDWNELVQTIDDAYPNFTSRLKNSFPLLSKDDLHFCCFLKIDVNLQDLSDIYCVSKSTITKKKYRVKTDKLCITNREISLDDFLKKF